MLTQAMLVVLMFVGGCAGSTAGGLKVSRVILLIKNAFRTVKKEVSPRSVISVKMDKSPVSEQLVMGVTNYFVTYALIMVISLVLLSLASPSAYGFGSNATAVITCINNVGPGLDMVGPTCNFSGYDGFSKIILILDMLMGRLEIIPILMLFYPKAWRKAK